MGYQRRRDAKNQAPGMRRPVGRLEQRLDHPGVRAVWLVIGLTALLTACGSSGSNLASPSPTAAATVSSGPGVTDAKDCAIPYGDAPAAVSTLDSGDGSAAVNDLLGVLIQCVLVGGETLGWTDANNEERKACLVTPPGATTTSKLPLLVFLQASENAAPPQLLINGWIPLTRTANLNGDSAHPGFILLLPIGRNTHHFYPFPDEYSLGWDNWYRNLDRSSPELNLDVAAIDQFIAQVESRNIVDLNRVYMSGWSNGAAMAQLYALNTPAIAASSVYSSPDPFSDVQDPCEQTPFATTMTPLMDIHNACDIIGICQTGTQFHRDVAKLFPALPQNSVIVDSDKAQVQACNSACAVQSFSANPVGALNHAIWPANWDDAMFTWLREHPLNSKQ